MGLYQYKKKRRKTVSNLPKKEELNTEIHEDVRPNIVDYSSSSCSSTVGYDLPLPKDFNDSCDTLGYEDEDLQRNIIYENDIETIGYEEGSELNEVLESFCKLLSEMMESLSTEYSTDSNNIIEMLPEHLWKNRTEGESDIESDNYFDEMRSAILKNLQKYIIEEKPDTPTDEHLYTSSSVSSIGMEMENHDFDTCHYHVPQHLQYAVNLIQTKETLVPLIKKKV